jgi:hypothetical protein
MHVKNRNNQNGPQKSEFHMFSKEVMLVCAFYKLEVPPIPSRCAAEILYCLSCARIIKPNC